MAVYLRCDNRLAGLSAPESVSVPVGYSELPTIRRVALGIEVAIGPVYNFVPH